MLANLAKQTPQEILAALQAGDVKIDPHSDSQEKTASILRCIDYSHSNLSPDAQQLLLCLAPFTSVIDIQALRNYTKYLKQQPLLVTLPFDRWPEVLREAQNWGLLSPHEVPGYLHMQPTLAYFLRNRLNESGQVEVRRAIETAFREHYDRLGDSLLQLLLSKKPRERQIGQVLTGLEYENLVTALNLALATQVSILATYRTLFQYLYVVQDPQRGLQLSMNVLDRLKSYPADRLSGLLGVELVNVLDRIANGQLALKQYAAAEKSYQKALEAHLAIKSFDEATSKKQSAGIYHQLGMVAQGQRQWQQALKIKIEYNDRYGQADTYHNLGMVARGQRQWQQAEQYFQQALKIKIEYNDRYSQARSYLGLGLVARERQQWQQAGEYLLRALQIFVKYEDNYWTGITLQNLTRLWKSTGEASLPAAVAPIMGWTVKETEALCRKIGTAIDGGG